MAAAISSPPNNHRPKLSATGRAVLGRREEIGKLPAALFALVVHIGFFALIIFGVSWQVKVTAPLSAALWSELPPVSLPKPSAPPPVEPTPPEPVVKAVEPPPPPKPMPAKPVPVEPSKADIALKVKKERDEELKVEQQKRDEKKRVDDKKKADEIKAKNAEDIKRKATEEKLRVEAEAREAQLAGARQRAVNDYAARIGALIRSRANIPDSVTGKPIVEVRLRLLTQGVVLDAQIVRPSGNKVFDDAVERAINGIRQWPVPDDPSIFGKRPELNLRIEHER